MTSSSRSHRIDRTAGAPAVDDAHGGVECPAISSPRRHRGATAPLLSTLALLLLASGCNIDFNASVPCGSDGDCPSSMVCDQSFTRCVTDEGSGDLYDAGDSEDAQADLSDGSGDSDGPPPRDIGRRDDGAEVTDSSDVPSTDGPDVGDLPVDGSGDAADTPPPIDTGACTPTGPEVCDEIDNDCNGTVDDPPVCDGECGAGMTIIDRDDGNRYCIDTYEASRLDATAESSGVDATSARSVAGVLPWSGVGLAEAQAACAEASKRLCTAFEWQAACQGGSLTLYPYGSSYNGAACNGSNSPPLDRAVPTGEFATCRSEDGTHDQSGNLAEWTADGIIRGGAFADPQLNLRCSSRGTPNPADPPRPSYGFRCCRDAPDP